MYVSPAQAPYEGVYQRQPTGLPKAEFIPQYPVMPSAPPSDMNSPQMPNGYQQPPMQYPPQPAYQNNNYGGQMYVPQQVCISFFICLVRIIFSNKKIYFSTIKCHHHTNNLNKIFNKRNVIKENEMNFYLYIHSIFFPYIYTYLF